MTTASSTDWALAARDAAAKLAVDALERDRANAEPLAEAQLLRDHGLPSLLLPAEVGGGGGTWADALRAVREVAVADGSIAQLLGYHYVNQANLAWVADEPTRRRWQERTGPPQWLWGDAVNPVDPDLALTPRGDGGYRLSGRKSFATGVSSGDVSVVSGHDSGSGRSVLVVVERGAAGVQPGGDWDNLGQRLSASGSVTFTDVEVPAENVLGFLDGEAATPRASLVTPAIQAVFGNFYVGVVRGALQTAAEYTRTTSRAWLLSDSPSAAQDPYVLASYGRLVARLRAAEALADQVGVALVAADEAGDALTWEERGELAELIAALKVVSSDLAVEATSAVFEVTGARATSNRVGLDRFWRNVRTHTLHDPVQYKAREVGDHFLNGTHPEFTLYT
ncbi:acyl-CoA dehydrogenase family protein [Quadrisphaera sp. INWT6]|uniref:acyl-CoA dehydrogenase family protein n=1 Tax=Quadrisphaera sp. INWT6 TaxID=2596917 RepID=UPI00189226D0|nr:acyl-CoA dehydrogenase family protein [Quadrisphaera sp. INWT6]MBF5082956.1 acyl-CoA dehydrogenase [Quadrisphaera sp. INWT6]